MSQSVDARRLLTERIAHNVRARRHECGLSLEGVAKRSGLTDVWIAAVEEGMAVVGPVALARLATALDTSVAHLGGGEDVPGAAPYARERQDEATADRSRVDKGLKDMEEAECYARLAMHCVGRISTVGADPTILPVNYVLDDRDIVFRTAEGSSLAGTRPTVAFEVDDLLTPAKLGWSVLVIGAVEQVTEAADVERLSKGGLTPWPDDAGDAWMRIRPEHVTGRRITGHGAGSDGAPSASGG